MEQSEFIMHEQSEDVFDEVLIMQKHGKAFARLYMFHDDPKKCYLNWLSVSPDARRNGIGTRLQELREELGIARGAEVAHLVVDKESWMYEWYKRRGYVEYQDHEEGQVWMKKQLV